MSANANSTFIFPISFKHAFGIGGICTGNSNNDNSNVISYYNENYTSVFIRGTYSSGSTKGFQNNPSKIVVIGY